MDAECSKTARARIESVYRDESRRVFATLIGLLGDFDAAEEALHDAFAAAIVQWPKDGVPDNPRAWLVSTGRFKAIDPLEGGSTKRHGLYLTYTAPGTKLGDRGEIGDGFTWLNYVTRYDFALYSNFTFFSRDEVNGDMIRQGDTRTALGSRLSYGWWPASERISLRLA